MADQSSPRPDRNSVVVGITAAVAGVAGVVAIAVGTIGLVMSLIDSAEQIGPTTTSPFVASTSASSAATTTSTTSASSTTFSFDPAGLVELTDDTGALAVSLPAEWDDVTGGPWIFDEIAVGLTIGAAVDRGAWYSGWGTPGAFVGVATADPAVYSPELDDFSESCSPGANETREYEGWTALVQEWVGCGVEGSTFHVAVVTPAAGDHRVLFQVVTLGRDGSQLIDAMVATLRYDQ